MTNEEKFMEVFGFYPDEDQLIFHCPEGDMECCKYYDSFYGECRCDRWWKEEYAGTPSNEERDGAAASNVNHPNHYAQGRKYEPIDVIEDWDLGFSLGNAVKYISRAGRKQDYDGQDQTEKTIEDLTKARWYLDYVINSYDPN